MGTETLFKTGDRERDITENMGLVYMSVKRFLNKGIEYDDLVSAGSLGLIRAYNKFDQSRGFAFSTYAVPLILGEIKQLFRENSTLKISRSLKDLSMKIHRETDIFIKEQGRDPTISELSEILCVTDEEITEAISAVLPVASLSFEDENENTFEIPVEFKEDKILNAELLKKAAEILEPKERTIIYLRYFRERTQAEIGLRLGISQVQVSRIEKRALQKLKTHMSD